MTRRVAAWACIFAWLLLITGPLHHSVGHEDDHIHVDGAIVPLPGAAAHTHADADASLAGAIAEARRAWTDPDESPEPRHTPDEPAGSAHGFDSLAHFATPPLPAVVALPEVATLTLATHDSPSVATASPHLRETRSASIRGPPASSV